MKNYANQTSKLMETLRANGMTVEGNGVGFYTNGYYVESSSVTNIYKQGELQASYKTPKSALNYLLKN